MAFTLEEFNGMELMWEQLRKTPDGVHVSLTTADVDEMWHCGIVDTAQFPIEKWRAAFDGHKQADSSYLLNKDEFLAMEPFRYKGEIMIPFDASLINEGKYTDEGLKELFDLSISPSCSFTLFQMNKFLEDLKSEFREPDGLVRIEFSAKSKIKDMINSNPSPLRRLELIFDYLIKDFEAKVAKDPDLSTLPAGMLSAEQIAKIQVSSFSMRTTDSLQKLEKRAPKKDVVAPNNSGVSIKNIKRSRKGVRG